MSYMKRTKLTKKALVLVGIFTAALCSTFLSYAAEVTARLSSSTIEVGGATNLIINAVYQNEVEQPTLPVVDGLMSTPMGVEKNLSSINGVVSQSRKFRYVLFSQKPGKYTLPSFDVVVDGEAFTTDPLTITVVAKKKKKPKSNEFDISNYAALGVKYFTSTDKPVYVGQMIPVQISILFDDNSTEIATLPRLKNDAFIITELSGKPQSSRNYQGNRLITTYRWVAGITPVKAGTFKVSLSSDAKVGLVDRTRRSFFGRPAVKTVDATIESKPDSIVVLPLPEEGKPKDFSGAIGQFTLKSSISIASANIGDPVTLKTVIEGQGNFSRVAEPILGKTDGWKLYPSSENFTGEDSISYKGTKSFEQALIPLDQSVTSVPSLSFSYFDTSKKEYVTLKTKEHAITIGKGNANGSNVVRFTERDDDGSDQDKPILPMIDADGLAPIKLQFSSSKSLVPLVRQSYFGYICGGVALWFVIAIILRRFIEKYSANEERRNKKSFEAAVKSRLKQIKRIASSGQINDSVTESIDVVKKCIAAYCSCIEESVSMHEIDQVFGSESAAAELFMAAESSLYSGGDIAVENIDQLIVNLESEVLALLEKL